MFRSAKFLLALIKNAQANAEVNGLDKDELFVKNIVIQQAPKMRCVLVLYSSGIRRLCSVR